MKIKRSKKTEAGSWQHQAPRWHWKGKPLCHGDKAAWVWYLHQLSTFYSHMMLLPNYHATFLRFIALVTLIHVLVCWLKAVTTEVFDFVVFICISFGKHPSSDIGHLALHHQASLLKTGSFWGSLQCSERTLSDLMHILFSCKPFFH